MSAAYSRIWARSFGIADTITSFASGAVEKKREAQFKEMVQQMSSTANWTLRPWRATIEAQLSGWTMYIPGVSSSNQVQEIKGFKAILDVMTDNELDNPDTINGPVRDRIATASAKSTDDVSKLLLTFKQSRVLASWLWLK